MPHYQQNSYISSCSWLKNLCDLFPTVFKKSLSSQTSVFMSVEMSMDSTRTSSIYLNSRGVRTIIPIIQPIIIDTQAEPSVENKYIFNGDIVDRGSASLQCIVLLLAWHTASPQSMYINRGNHEAINMNLKDGFHKELMEKYNDNILFDFFQEVFSWLPVATLVSEKVLILHGGLSSIPDLDLDDIRRIPRGSSFQPDDSDLLCDLLWSDPMQVGTGIRESSRGGGVLFGADITATFLHHNSLQCLVRSHSEITEGCTCSHPGCYTVFSAPDRARNINGGILTLYPTETEHLRMEGFVFQEVTELKQ